MSDYLGMMLKLTEMERHQSVLDFATLQSQPLSQWEQEQHNNPNPSPSQSPIPPLVRNCPTPSLDSDNSLGTHIFNGATRGVPTGLPVSSCSPEYTQACTALRSLTPCSKPIVVRDLAPGVSSGIGKEREMYNGNKAQANYNLSCTPPPRVDQPVNPREYLSDSTPTTSSVSVPVRPGQSGDDDNEGESLHELDSQDTKKGESQETPLSCISGLDTADDDNSSYSPIRVTLPSTKLYFGKPLKLSICVVRSWRLAVGIPQRQIFTAGLNMTCISALSAESFVPSEVHCFKCRKYTGRQGKVFKVWVDNYFPEGLEDSPIEKYCFVIQSLCSSSRDHLGGAVRFSINLGNLTAASRPLHLRARIKKPLNPSGPKVPSSKTQKEMQKPVDENSALVPSIPWHIPTKWTTTVPVTVRILTIKLPSDVVANAVVQHRSFRMPGAHFQSAQMVEAKAPSNGIWAIVTLFENLEAAELSNNAWSTAMRHIIDAGFIQLHTLFRSWE
ncbi:hypothetical protein Pelo_2033 [Pelomyxa schiedti]|nr:hypothetical protein Pelo_2033 [Pelomyxa schiedti]